MLAESGHVTLVRLDPEQLRLGALRQLREHARDRDDRRAAELLECGGLACELEVLRGRNTDPEPADGWSPDDEERAHYFLNIALREVRPAARLGIPEDRLGLVNYRVGHAIEALVPTFVHVNMRRYQLPPEYQEGQPQQPSDPAPAPEPEPRDDVHNQGVGRRRISEWEGLRFRSESEVRIAKVLDQGGVLFFPNCRGRLNVGKRRDNREADFLVCHEGRWGILEVDGEPYHPSAAEDHERDRLFRAYGIHVERYTSERCFETPHVVVEEFLELLRRSPGGR